MVLRRLVALVAVAHPRWLVGKVVRGVLVVAAVADHRYRLQALQEVWPVLTM